MAELTKAFIEELAARCSAASSPPRRRPSAPSASSEVMHLLSGRMYQRKLASLRRRLQVLANEQSDLHQFTACEWFLDNFYAIAQHAETLRRDLPPSFYAQLPRLRTESNGKLTHPARAFVLAEALFVELSSPPGRVQFEAFLTAVQVQAPLRIGELWAFPAMLRAICLDRMVEALEHLAARGQGAETNSAWTSARAAEVVSFAVRTLIELKTVPWRQVFERCSLVHGELGRDPSGIYTQMDFETCDRYRQAVEVLAAQSARDELAIAKEANAMATEARNATSRGAPAEHVGYYLIGEGREQLEGSLRIRPDLRVRLGRTLLRYATPVYFTAIALLMAVLLLALCLYMLRASAGPLVIVLACAVALVPCSDFAIAWVQWLISTRIEPRRLPRLSSDTSIDAKHRTLVVIPTLLGEVAEVHSLVRRLELHYLANPDPLLGFVLLVDYVDALTEKTPLDRVMVERARGGIDLLNHRYAQNGRAPFHLLVRERRFNASQGVWMGWERKRGKLEEFNRFLAGQTDTSYSIHVGDKAGLQDTRFVITLDSDTELPRDAARRLVATLRHPLNRAYFEGDRLRSGYTVLQPRLDTNPESSHRSRFSWIFSGDTGLDIYTRAVSDVYQDFFGSGVYVGKGIYDVDAFRRCLEGKVPENALLSHDLFEGISGRAGLVSDVVLYEDYPPSYLSYARRLHRWIRGDWQLLPWLGRRVPMGAGPRIANPFSNIDRWKVVDNLRRSLRPIALLVLLLSAWTWLPGSPLAWTGISLLLSAGHVLTSFASGLPGLLTHPLRSLSGSVSRNLHSVNRWLLSLVFLPHEAVVVTDAVLRTLLRLAFTRKRLLEWTTAAHSASMLALRSQRRLQWWEMLGGPVSALAVASVLWWIHPGSLTAAAGFLLVWLLSPEVSLFLGRAGRSRTEALRPEQAKLLRTLSRRIWLFFETFVGPADHWLPPDNVQMVPELRIAHRTSPTNIGLYLASCATACDLGYLGLREFCVRVQSTLRTLDELPRHRGQLLNWYETRSLDALLPRYVSTVDNGNFAAALIAVRQACGDFATAPVFRSERLDALGDVAELLLDCIVCHQRGQAPHPAIVASANQMRATLEAATGEPEGWLDMVEQLEALVDEVSSALKHALHDSEAGDLALEYEALDWLEVLHREVRSMRAYLLSLAGWFYTLWSPPAAVVRDPGQRACWLALRDETFAAGFEQLRGLHTRLEQVLASCQWPAEDEAAAQWSRDVRSKFELALIEADALLADTLDVGGSCERELAKIDFGFLYDSDANQMFIGYDASSSQPDRHHYDLLASEARLASLVAIALDQVPSKHWAHLGRPVSDKSVLLSWSGTMFEYLMPLLFTRSYPSTLLGRSTSGAVSNQMHYGRAQGVPWGISESAFATSDAKGDYQYRAFGSPGLGLKRGLEEDLVIAPYASVLALGLNPVAVVDNLRALRALGAWGEYGAVEAIDFTPHRVRPLGRRVSSAKGKGRSGTLVEAYMAHHQGMSMIAIGNALAKESMVERFHADPRVQTVANLLQEKPPRGAPRLRMASEERAAVSDGPVERLVFSLPWSPRSGSDSSSIAKRLVDPGLHALSNGHLSLLVDSFGRSRLWLTHGREEIDIRPREIGASQDRAGSFCVYVQVQGQPRRLISGGLATGTEGNGSQRQVTFWPHKVESRVHLGSLGTVEEVFLAPHDNVELRRLRLINEGKQPLQVSVTGYAELSLQRAEEHHRHPAFSRLFLQARALERGRILVCERRARGPGERFPVAVQAMLTHDSAFLGWRDWQTSRSRFIGRGRSLDDPCWQGASTGPVNREASVLDPCMAQAVQLSLKPGESQTVAWVTAIGIDQQRALETLTPFLKLSSLTSIQEQSARAMRQRLGKYHLRAAEEALYQLLLSRMVHRSDERRAGGLRARLWGHGISGDNPIVVVHRRSEDAQLLAQLLRAQRYFVEQNLLWDLVVVVHDATGYSDEAREQLRRLARSIDLVDLHPNVSIVAKGQLQAGDLRALEAAAGVVLDSDSGSLSEQLARDVHQAKLLPLFKSTHAAEGESKSKALARRSQLLFDNGWGGFDRASNEYVLYLGHDQRSETQATPAPWCNVLSNPVFGTMVSERGLGCTWVHNASENRITPWSNDPVCDPPSEAVYLRDEETAAIWSPMPTPMPSELPYEIAHGIGYSCFRHASHELMHTLTVSVHAVEAVKFVELTLENQSERHRRLTITYCADWVLGGRSATHGPHVTASYDPDTGALVASNPWNTSFPTQAAFLVGSEKTHGFTVDPTEFLGLGGWSQPDALRRLGLSNSDKGSALSCGALQMHVDMRPGQTARLHFALGWGANRQAALTLAARSKGADFVAQARVERDQHWKQLLQRVAIATPDPALDLMLNTWALYQTVSSRIYGRTGFYQSSGAIGFRDQLQDLMSLSAIAPGMARAHILVVAAHQFDAGDVLHWWHPPASLGVRTRCSDDLVWLPYAVSRYIETTGDQSILDERVPFLRGAELKQGEHDLYGAFETSEDSATLYEHCMRALERAHTLGPHKLPLIGGGDWNDGMNLVGAQGRGESVWLGWFLYTVLQEFAPLCAARNQHSDERRLRARSTELLEGLEAAWDGKWYCRAYYDDGTALGSAASREARIDSISQSWAVISGAAQPARARQAIEAALNELFDQDARLVRLLWPPFDKERREPGYIKGYPPGIRENGAQYTHAATWLVWALFRLGESSKACELFRMLNPITHAENREQAQTYAVEPYVLAGDVYSVGSQRGRGGWSWYTGSAAWYWRIGVEELLGCRVRWPYLEIAPQIPEDWPACHLTMSLGTGTYEIEIINSEGSYEGVVAVSVDNKPLLYTGSCPRLDLRKHQQHHVVRVILGGTSRVQANAATH